MYSGPAPAIDRLGIKPYQFGTECLSGDVNAGPATSFPQSLGMVSRCVVWDGIYSYYGLIYCTIFPAYAYLCPIVLCMVCCSIGVAWVGD